MATESPPEGLYIDLKEDFMFMGLIFYSVCFKKG